MRGVGVIVGGAGNVLKICGAEGIGDDICGVGKLCGVDGIGGAPVDEHLALADGIGDERKPALVTFSSSDEPLVCGVGVSEDVLAVCDVDDVRSCLAIMRICAAIQFHALEDVTGGDEQVWVARERLVGHACTRGFCSKREREAAAMVCRSPGTG